MSLFFRKTTLLNYEEETVIVFFFFFFTRRGILSDWIQNQARKLQGWDYLNIVLAPNHPGGHLL